MKKNIKKKESKATKSSSMHFYGKGIPGVDTKELRGKLIVVEGGDGAGRTTQIILLKEWLERLGYPVTEVGLRQSELMGKELMEIMKGNMLCPLTLSLFYMTDFADQLENTIFPALRAGFVVLADRYIYTLMARHIVRSVSKDWLKEVCGIALIPNQVFYIKAKPQTLAERTFQKSGNLDFWESGMDIERSDDIYRCFIKYQRALSHEFDAMAKSYKFITVNGEKDALSVHAEIVSSVRSILKSPAIPSIADAVMVTKVEKPRTSNKR